MPKNDLLYIGHIYDTALKIESALKDKNQETFANDEILKAAITYYLQIIGEASNRISQEFKNEHPSIPWQAMIGMRHKLVHDYWFVDDNIVWQTATQRVPDLIKALQNIIKV